MSFNCIKCNSEDVRRLSIIHSDGLSNIDTTTSGSSISGGDGVLRAGSGTAKTTGTMQTDQSRKAAPPQKYSYFGIIVIWIIGTLLLMWFLGWLGLAVSGTGMQGQIFRYGSLIFLAWLFYKTCMHNWKIYPSLKAKWDNSFMCLRCGEIFEIKKQN